MKHLRSQSYAPLTDRRMRHNWLKDGGKDMTQRALEKARHILKTHKPLPIPEAGRKAIRDLINREEKSRSFTQSAA